MKTKINAILIVEGKTDIDFLSSFIDAPIYSVNGSAIEDKDFEFINEALKNNKVIVLTDPDFPGLQIRNKINGHCKGVYNAYVRKEVSIKGGKVGVAESTKEEVLNALKEAVKFEETNSKGSITTADLYELKLLGDDNSSYLRKEVSEKLHLGFSNSKSFLKKVNLLGISKEKLKETIENVKN